jgi:hypothetical protein
MFKKEAIVMASIPFAIMGVAIIVAIIAPYFFNDLCDNEVLMVKQSTQGTMKAVIFSRNCGATTDDNIQVSLLDKDETLRNESGNLFIANTGKGNSQVAAHGGPVIDIEWINDKNIQITYDLNTRIFKSEIELKSVNVVYSHEEIVNR